MVLIPDRSLATGSTPTSSTRYFNTSILPATQSHKVKQSDSLLLTILGSIVDWGSLRFVLFLSVLFTVLLD